MNQLVISGNRLKLFNLFSTSALNFSKFELCEINNNQFCTVFSMDYDKSSQFIQELAANNPGLDFQLFYADKLLSMARIITITDGDITVKKQNLHLTLKDMKEDLTFFNAFKELL